MHSPAPDHSAMVGRTRNASKRATKLATQLFIGQWIRALGRKPSDVARGIGLNEGYLSELISGSKKNTSGTVLMEIADFLDIPIQYLRRPPPNPDVIREVSMPIRLTHTGRK